MTLSRSQFLDLFDETQFPYWKVYLGRGRQVADKFWTNPNDLEDYDLLQQSRDKLDRTLHRTENGNVRIELFSSPKSPKENAIVSTVSWGSGRNTAIGSTTPTATPAAPANGMTMEVALLLLEKSNDVARAEREADRARWERDQAIAIAEAAQEEERPSAIQGMAERLLAGFLAGQQQTQVAALGTLGQTVPGTQVPPPQVAAPTAAQAAPRSVSIDAIVVRVRQIAALFPGVHVNDLMDAFVYIFSQNPTYVQMMEPTVRDMVRQLQTQQLATQTTADVPEGEQ